MADAMVRNDGMLNTWVNSPPQTNEVRRTAVLIAVQHLLTDRFGLAIRLSELGASGG
jgi:PTH1 family peptidyl-tRNA hydrolase